MGSGDNVFLHHRAAGFRASLASIGATLAAFHLVAAALLGALIADLGAQRAKAVGYAMTDLIIGTRHEGNGQAADVGAVTVQLDTIGHRLGVRSGNAIRGAAFAFVRTSLAGLDAVFVFLMHDLKVLGCEGQSTDNRAAYWGKDLGACPHCDP